MDPKEVIEKWKLTLCPYLPNKGPILLLFLLYFPRSGKTGDVTQRKEGLSTVEMSVKGLVLLWQTPWQTRLSLRVSTKERNTLVNYRVRVVGRTDTAMNPKT